MSQKQFFLFQTRRFLPLLLTQFLGAYNDNIFKNAMVVLIAWRLAAAAGMNAQIMITVAAGVFILPFFLFSATAGQFADKFDKTRLIRHIKLAEIIIMSMGAAGRAIFRLSGARGLTIGRCLNAHTITTIRGIGIMMIRKRGGKVMTPLPRPMMQSGI